MAYGGGGGRKGNIIIKEEAAEILLSSYLCPSLPLPSAGRGKVQPRHRGKKEKGSKVASSSERDSWEGGGILDQKKTTANEQLVSFFTPSTGVGGRLYVSGYTSRMGSNPDEPFKGCMLAFVNLHEMHASNSLDKASTLSYGNHSIPESRVPSRYFWTVYGGDRFLELSRNQAGIDFSFPVDSCHIVCELEMC
jgi:hypothetical protein